MRGSKYSLQGKKEKPRTCIGLMAQENDPEKHDGESTERMLPALLNKYGCQLIRHFFPSDIHISVVQVAPSVGHGTGLSSGANIRLPKNLRLRSTEIFSPKTHRKHLSGSCAGSSRERSQPHTNISWIVHVLTVEARIFFRNISLWPEFNVRISFEILRAS